MLRCCYSLVVSTFYTFIVILIIFYNFSLTRHDHLSHTLVCVVLALKGKNESEPKKCCERKRELWTEMYLALIVRDSTENAKLEHRQRADRKMLILNYFHKNNRRIPFG